MSIRQLNLTLDGTAQVLTGGIVGTWNDTPLKQIGIIADSANANKVQIGDSAVTASLHMGEIPIPASSVPYGHVVMDFPPGCSVRLKELYVKGTNTEKVHGWVVF